MRVDVVVGCIELVGVAVCVEVKDGVGCMEVVGVTVGVEVSVLVGVVVG